MIELIKCKFCGHRAIINLNYARMSLCEAHFVEYMIRRVEKTINRYGMVISGCSVLVAVSGGKDSATLLHLLWRLRDKLNIKLKCLHIDLGINGYSQHCRDAALRLSYMLKVPVLLITLEDLGIPLPRLVRASKRDFCSTCGIVKRYLMNFSALMIGASIVATGHVLDDVFSFALKTLLTSEISEIAKLRVFSKHLEGLAAAKIKPLIEISERESLAYALINKLPFYHGECPYRDKRFLATGLREFQSKLEDEHPGLRISFLRRMIKLSRSLSMDRKDLQKGIRKCSVCGMMTEGGKCAFCRLVEKAVGDPRLVNQKLMELLKINS